MARAVAPAVVFCLVLAGPVSAAPPPENVDVLRALGPADAPPGAEVTRDDICITIDRAGEEFVPVRVIGGLTVYAHFVLWQCHVTYTDTTRTAGETKKAHHVRVFQFPRADGFVR
jgi:hypothetical protein